MTLYCRLFVFVAFALSINETLANVQIKDKYIRSTNMLTEVLNELSIVKKSTAILPKMQMAFEISDGILEGVSSIVDLIFGNEDDSEQILAEMKKQFEMINSKLNTISADIEGIRNLLKWVLVQIKLQDAESRIYNTNIDLNKFIKHEGDYYKNEFIRNFESRDMVRTVSDLHSAIIGQAPFSTSIVRTFMNHVQFNRGKVAAMLRRVTQLVTMGMQEIVAYRRVTNAPDVADVIREWHSRTKQLQPIYEEALRECVDNFLPHARKDIEYELDKHNGKDNRFFADLMHNRLTSKYDWLQWSSSAYNPCHGYDQHTVGGQMVAYFRRGGRNYVAAWRDDCCQNNALRQKVQNYLRSGNFPVRPAHAGFQVVDFWLRANNIPYTYLHVVRWGNGLRSTTNPAMTLFENRERDGHHASFIVML